MKIRILAGPVCSGKTTRLSRWATRQASVRGILSPVISGRRRFVHLPDGEHRQMEAGRLEGPVYSTPRYRFSVSAFHWAEGRLKKDMQFRPDWLIIDEIGKLELRGDGFSRVLGDILEAEAAGNLLLVVRSGLVESVQERFGIGTASAWEE